VREEKSMHPYPSLVRIASVVAVAVAAACASSNRSSGNSAFGPGQSSSQAWVQERAQGGSQAEQQVARAASEAQAGKLVAIRGDALVLDPYQEAAGNAEITLANDVKVFRGDQTVNRSELQPGQDVNVYFDRQGGKPRALGITILSPDQANKLQAALRNQPRRG
jgi:hypothetical protein